MNKELPPYVCGLEEFEIRAIALDCGFQLKPQPDGPDDLNPYVYKFANEILSTVPSPEDVARFRKALDENAASVANNEMTNIKEFEKVMHDYATKHLTGSTALARRIAAHFYDARQSEIDALKHKLAVTDDGFRAAEALLKSLRSENDTLKAEVERLGNEHGLLGSAIGNAAIKAGITHPDADLTGPMLVMVCDNLADAAMLADAPTPPALQLKAFDAGILNTFGGGDRDWWLDYIRSLLSEAHAHYQEQVTTTPPAPECKCDLRTRLVGDGCEICNPELAAEMAAPEVAPVAYLWEETRSEETNEPHERQLSFRPPDTTGYITQSLNRQWGKVTPLYTHPANDGLRKAAEEVVEQFYNGDCDDEQSITNLRSELNKDRP